MPTWSDIQKKIASSKYSDAAEDIFKMDLADASSDGIVTYLSQEKGETLKTLFEVTRFAWLGKSLIAQLVSEEKWALIAKLAPVLSKITENQENQVFTNALLKSVAKLMETAPSKELVDPTIKAACLSLLGVRGLAMEKKVEKSFSAITDPNVLQMVAYIGDFDLYAKARAAGAVLASPRGFYNISRCQPGVCTGSPLSLAVFAENWEMLLSLSQSPEWSKDCITHFGQIIAEAGSSFRDQDRMWIAINLIDALLSLKERVGEAVIDCTQQYYEKVADMLIFYNQVGFFVRFLAQTQFRLEDSARLVLKAAIPYCEQRPECAEMKAFIYEHAKRSIEKAIWFAVGKVDAREALSLRGSDKWNQFQHSMDEYLAERFHMPFSHELTEIKNNCIEEFLSALSQVEALAKICLDDAVSSKKVLGTKLIGELADHISAAFFDESRGKDRRVVLERFAQYCVIERRNQIAACVPDQILFRVQEKLFSLMQAITTSRGALVALSPVMFSEIAACLSTVLHVDAQRVVLPQKATAELREKSNEALFGEVVKTVVGAVVQLEEQNGRCCHPRIAVEAARVVLMKMNSVAGFEFGRNQLEQWLTSGFSDRNLGRELKSSLFWDDSRQLVVGLEDNLNIVSLA